MHLNDFHPLLLSPLQEADTASKQLGGKVRWQVSVIVKETAVQPVPQFRMEPALALIFGREQIRDLILRAEFPGLHNFVDREVVYGQRTKRRNNVAQVRASELVRRRPS